MKDFNIAALLLKNFDADKWARLPSLTKKKLVNEFLEFRNRLLIAADIGNHSKVLKEEVEKAESRMIAKPDTEEIDNITVERKTEAEIIAEYLEKQQTFGI